MPRKKDIVWFHCKEVEGNHNDVICNYCGKQYLGGGITRFKKHLAGGDPNVETCSKCGKEVRDLFRKIVDKQVERKNAKAIAGKEFHDVFLHVPGSSEDESGDEEARDIRRAMQDSLADQWNEDKAYRLSRSQSQFVNSQREAGSLKSSCDPELIDLDTERLPDTRQSTIPSKFDKQRNKGWGAKFRNLFAKMAHYRGINANQIVGNNPYTQPCIDAACRAGLGVKVPTRYELMGPELKNIVSECDMFIDSLRKKWSLYSVTIMCDGWTGPTRHSLMNFMIYYANLLRNEMKKVVDWVGKEYVVQIVTDNGANYKKEGEDLCKLPEFCRKDMVADLIAQARKITKYMYNHSQVCDLMRNCCSGDIVRPALTRFATNFMALQSMLNKMEERQRDRKMQEVEDIINKRQFWRDVKELVECFQPMVEILRKWMMNLKDKIKKTKKYPKWCLDLVERRWERQLSHTLHKAEHRGRGSPRTQPNEPRQRQAVTAGISTQQDAEVQEEDDTILEQRNLEEALRHSTQDPDYLEQEELERALQASRREQTLFSSRASSSRTPHEEIDYDSDDPLAFLDDL
ncbi:hypothetical protein AQUCO_05600036v1 [Aquilegia coerulea]|uniref:BED-type domain-containing protein n=1 Tax=Aquilegia coerulea TaxID=218851 RepID=A0A2G5CGA9_AQUCA|nr:hypothetical protein AQUCO_05600036v1 [Aquilegia coerulea]